MKGAKIPRRTANELLAELYAAQGAAAARLAYFLTGDPESAQDIAHEAFVRVGSRLSKLRQPEKSAGYLFRTVLNLSRGYGRTAAKNRRLLAKLNSDVQESPPDLELRDELWRALMCLPKRQRTVLFLRFYVGHSERETAEYLDLSVAATKSLTHRASRRLRTGLEEERLE